MIKKKNISSLLSLYVFPNPLVYFSLSLGLINSVIELALTFFLSKIFSAVEAVKVPLLNISLSRNEILLLIIFLLFLKVSSTGLLQYLVNKVQRIFHKTFSVKIYENLLKKIPLNEFFQKGPGHYFSLAGDESFKLSSSISNALTTLNTTILLFAYVLFLSLTSFNGLIAFFGFVLLSLIFGSFLFNKMKKNGETQVNLGRIANSKFNDGTNNIKTIRSYMSEDFFILKYSDELTNYTKALLHNDLLSIVLKLVPTFFILIIFALLILTSNQNDFSEISLVAIVFFRLLPLTGTLYTSLLKTISDIKSINDVCDMLSINQPPKEKFTGDIKKIEFRNISFGYQDKTLIKNLNLIFQSGKFYAIHGESGLGKSTLFDILLGFKKDFKGHILINDTFLKPETDLRPQITLVEQSTSIFNESILDNFLLGRPSVKKDEMKALLSISELTSTFDVENLNHKISFKGSNISGGQRQRISILRSFISNPSVIIFDETLVGIDSKTKIEILKNIKAVYPKKIFIFITHDLDIINACDEVIDLNNFKKINL